jgi:UDP-glucose 4-epimerase
LGTAALLQASVHHGVRRFLFASTGGALYGDADVIPTPEDYPTLPVSPYGASKLAAEVYLRTFHALHGLSYTALRYANVYGPRQDPHGEAGVVAIFAQRLLSGERARINGDGKQTRDFVFVGDVADANARALASDAVGSFNVGTGIETDITTIFQLLKRFTGSNQPEEHGPPLPGEQRRSVVDARKMEKVLGWKPKTNLEVGLDATVRYFREVRPVAEARVRPA